MHFTDHNKDTIE